MSIQLPRSLKELHFTGSVKALAAERERPAHPLGQQRPKATPPAPRSRAAPLSAPPPPVRAGQVPPTHAPNAPSAKKAAKLETMRGPLVSLDEEEINTQSLDREAINAALFPIARRPKGTQPAPNLPVPHFRSAAAAKAHHAEPAIVKNAPKGGALPLGVWLVTAMIAGIVSYNFAPQAVETVTQAVHAITPP